MEIKKNPKRIFRTHSRKSKIKVSLGGMNTYFMMILFGTDTDVTHYYHLYADCTVNYYFCYSLD